MNYIRLCNALYDKGTLIPPTELHNYVSSEKDYYASTFFYDESQFQTFKETGTVRKIRDVKTNKLWWDFDNKLDPDKAKQACLELVGRLKKVGINDKDIEIYFSGNKGFNVVLTVDRWLTPEEVYHICVSKFGADLIPELDVSLYDSTQILRVPGTRHQVSGLYKVPVKVEHLYKPIEEIKARAASLDNITEDFEWAVVNPGDDFYDVSEYKETKQPVMDATIQKPNQWRNCKWEILQGNFKTGERHNAMLVLAATCRGMGFDKITTYHMCKSAAEKQSTKSGQSKFSKEELWENIIEQSIFTDNWEGGQYTCQKPGWLQTYCRALGDSACKNHEEEPTSLLLDDMVGKFTNYADNFEQNVIKIGIPEMDNNIMLCSSTLNGLLGQPGSGKTSFSLNYLRNSSLSGVNSMFFSLDMGMPLVYAKLIQKKTGLPFKEVLRIFKEDKKRAYELNESIKNDYRNVGFNFKSGLTVPDIKTSVVEHQEKTGTPVKLVIIDYLECLAGPYADPLANSGFVANQLKDLANDLQTCILLLLQTQKHSTPDISDPLLTLKGVKGSSLIEQSCSTILTLWREGYNPRTVENDKYVSFAVVKNRFGSLWSDDFSWNGVTGNISELSEEQRYTLNQFREEKANIKAQKNAEWE